MSISQETEIDKVIEQILINQKCSISGLPIKTDEKYQKIVCSPDYFVSFYMIGERILLTCPEGDSSSIDLEVYYEGRKKFLDKYGPSDKKIVEIRNFSKVFGFPNKKSRLVQTENLKKESDNLLTFIIMHAPVYVRLVFRVGMKIHKVKFPMLFINNYKGAIKKACSIIEQEETSNLSPEMLKVQEKYNVRTPSFQATFSTYSNLILHIRGTGMPDAESIKALCEKETRLYKEYFSENIPIFRIVDYTNIQKSSFKVRVIYSKHLRKLYQKGKNVRATFVIGANPLIKASISMLSKIVIFNTVHKDSLEDTFEEISKAINTSEKDISQKSNLTNNEYEKISKQVINNKIDELLVFMGSLTWEKPLESFAQVENDHIFKPVYDALAVIKNDIDNLLLERKKDAEMVKSANRRLELDLKVRKKSELERKELEEQLQQSEKMQAIGQLAGGIAHDFNNQLAAIVGYNDLLRRNLPEDSKLRKYTDNIKMVSNRAKDLTGQLLAFARKGKYHSTAVNIHNLIDEVSSLSKHTMDKKIRIKQELMAINPEVEGDPNQLQNVLLNLSINARDAMPDGGDMIFITENIDSDSPWFQERNIALSSGSYLKVTVSDSGSGIPEGIKRHIFEPFFTTKKTGQGTGMGLAAVYGTIKNHHGSIEVDTVPGKGASFHILLPQINIEVNTPEDFDSKDSESIHNGFGDTIFLIDDEESILETTTELLQELGYTVFESQNPIDAIDIYKKAYEKIDVVLLDMIMPEMGGADVFRELKKINSDVKVIITSGFSIEHEQQLINDNKSVYFLQKPYEIEDLNIMVNKLIHESDDA